MSKLILTLFRRDITLSLRHSGGAGAGLAFILAFLVLIPLALGPDLATLQRLGPGLMWLALLLAVLLTTERMFQPDFEDGSLDLLTLSSLPLEVIALVKALAHWLTVSLPLAIAAPLLGVLLAIDAQAIPQLMLAMIIGSFALSLLAGIGGAITAGLRRGGLLVPLLILPLYVPVLIFGLSASQSHLMPSSATASLLVLVALAMVALVVQPWASAAALRAYLR